MSIPHKFVQVKKSINMKNINLGRKIAFLSILLFINAESLFSNINSDNDNYSNFIQQPIKGIVTDFEGLPLPGVSIVVKGTSNGVQTDFDGNFSIEAQSEDILVFSYIGMETLSVEVSDASDSINISMQALDSNLENVRSVRTDLGVRMNRVDDQQSLNENFNVRLQETLSGLEDLDYTKAITEMNLQMVALEAAQKAYTKTQSLSLFNYL